MSKPALKPVIRIFKSAAAMNQADKKARQALTPIQRLEDAEDLRRRYYKNYAASRIQRVYKIVKYP